MVKSFLRQSLSELIFNNKKAFILKQSEKVRNIKVINLIINLFKDLSKLFLIKVFDYKTLSVRHLLFLHT